MDVIKKRNIVQHQIIYTFLLISLHTKNTFKKNSVEKGYFRRIRTKNNCSVSLETTVQEWAL